MTGIEMTVDAVQVKLLCIHIVIQMSLAAIRTEPHGKEVRVAFNAGLIIYHSPGMFQLALSLPVERCTVPEMIGKPIMHSDSGLCPDVAEISLWG